MVCFGKKTHLIKTFCLFTNNRVKAIFSNSKLCLTPFLIRPQLMNTDTTQTDGLHCVEKTQKTKAVTSRHNLPNSIKKRKVRQNRAQNKHWVFCDGGTWISTLLLPWRQDTGSYRPTDVHIYSTCSPSHIRESSPKVRKRGQRRRHWAVWHFKLSSCCSVEMSYYWVRHIYQSQKGFHNGEQQKNYHFITSPFVSGSL